MKDQEKKDMDAAAMYARHKLTKIQRRFVENYHRTGQAEQSAIDAGYAEGSAKVRASELLADSRIKLMLRDMANGVLGEPEELDEQYIIRRLLHITEVAMMRGKDGNAIKALELLGRHLKMFTDKLEINPVEGLAERLAEARARVNAKQDALYQFKTDSPEIDDKVDPQKLN